MNEQHFYQTLDSAKLYSVLYEPDESDSAKGGIIFCDPWSREKFCVTTPYVEMARSLCSAGYHVLRLDCRGTGDSDGDTGEATLTSQVEDIKLGIDLLEERGVGNIGLLGLRVGALVAAVVAKCDPRVRFLMLWELMPDAKDHFDELYRRETVVKAWIDNSRSGAAQLAEALQQDGFIDVRGYTLSEDAYKQFSSIDVLQVMSEFRGPILALNIAHNPRIRREAEENLSNIFNNTHGDLYTDVVEDYEFWTVLALEQVVKSTNQLRDTTLTWLNNMQRGA